MQGFSSREYDEPDLNKVLEAMKAQRGERLPRVVGPLVRPEDVISARPTPKLGELQTYPPSYVFDPPSRTASKGTTVEGIARDQYGYEWRAGIGAIMNANRLPLNVNGSPILAVGQKVQLPSLEDYGTEQRARLGAAGGQVVADNTARQLEQRQRAWARSVEGSRYSGLKPKDYQMMADASYRDSLAMSKAAEQRAQAGALVAQRLIPRDKWGAEPPQPTKMTRASGSYNTITLHHTGDLHQTPQSVQALHLGRENWWRRPLAKLGAPLEAYEGYGDVGYNYMVGKDGSIFEGRSQAMQGGHVSGHNPGNLGVAALGDYSNKALTAPQLASIRVLTTVLSGRYPIKDVATHGEFDQRRKDEMRGAMPQLSDFLR